MLALSEALWQDDERMSGQVCFRGTRIPLEIFFQYLEANQMDRFRSGYPDVTEEQIQSVLEVSRDLVLESFWASA